jgi:glycolate permease/lactate permease
MVSPQNLTIGAAAVGLTGQEGALLRRTILWSLGLATAIGVLAMLQAHVVPFVIPPLP